MDELQISGRPLPLRSLHCFLHCHHTQKNMSSSIHILRRFPESCLKLLWMGVTGQLFRDVSRTHSARQRQKDFLLSCNVSDTSGVPRSVHCQQTLSKINCTLRRLTFGILRVPWKQSRACPKLMKSTLPPHVHALCLSSLSLSLSEG